MRYLCLLVCLALLSACGNETSQATSSEVLFEGQRSALEKSKDVEGLLLDADQNRRAQLEAQE
jgi:hypothetical protein